MKGLVRTVAFEPADRTGISQVDFVRRPYVYRGIVSNISMVLYLRESREAASLKTGGNTDFIFALNGQPFRAFCYSI